MGCIGESQTCVDRGPSRAQVGIVRAITKWYLETYHGTPYDLGVPAMFMQPSLVGFFSLSAEEFERGNSRALFRLFVATILFQRRQDQQILRILRGLSAPRVRELTSVSGLLRMARNSPCRCVRTQALLLEECDLTKDAEGRGICRTRAPVRCHLKRHSEWLRRYGHFGKVPTSASFMLQDAGASSMSALYENTVRLHREPRARAEVLADTLQRAWRVSEKISGMFLSMVTNPDLSSLVPPWREVDWSCFVAIDSNTDELLRSIGYSGARTYSARRLFLRKLADRVDLKRLKHSVTSYNPRIVQQAAYMFMSKANRSASPMDCWRNGNCRRCTRQLRTRCPVRDRR